MKNVKVLHRCRVCNSSDLHDFFDLGNIPIPNGFLTRDDVRKKEERYPLSVLVCRTCYLVQLRYIVNPAIMFKNYLYIPSSSQTRLQHFRDLAQDAVERFYLSERSLVVDIGSNDGSLLTAFKNLNTQVLGIDPAENLVTIAELNGIPTIASYVTPTVAKKIIKRHGEA